MKPIIKVENLSKQYRLGLVGTGTFAHDVNRWWHTVRGKEDPYLKIGDVNDRAAKGESEYVWALKDINFDVMPGEVLGIIGKNGAGKSTLLKLLSRVTGPTTGSIEARGRIASLLEVGTGFHPELTGRENVFLNGAILGMTKKEISSKLDEMVEFSGCERYIDTPVKRYSSGMKVRLAFAVAAHLEPEILIVDEVLAVGDAEFQAKAIGKMQDVSKGDGRTVLFVSHNMASIQALCSRCVLLSNGTVVADGDVPYIISEYLKKDSKDFNPDLTQRFSNKKKPAAYFTAAYIQDEDGEILNAVISGQSISIVLKFKFDPTLNIDKLNFFIGLYNAQGEKVLHLGSIYSSNGMEITRMGKEGIIKCHFRKLPLPEGVYSLNLSMHNVDGRMDHVSDAFQIHVDNGDFFGTGKVPPSSVNKVLVEQMWGNN